MPMKWENDHRYIMFHLEMGIALSIWIKSNRLGGGKPQMLK